MSPKGYEVTKQSLAVQLFEAVEEQNLQEILKLLECDKVDPNVIIPSKGISPFHLVIGCECTYFAEEATRAFLQRNGNPNIQSEDGLTPVHIASVWGRTNLLELLLCCGGDPWLRDIEHGFTPLHYAIKEKHWETALILQRYQLLDRRNRHSEGLIVPRFNVNLETIVVNAGEMQAEYAVSPQGNVYPVLFSPPQESKEVNSKYNWNIEPVETQEYVRQWCRKEFTPLPVTSTPTHKAHKSLNGGNVGQLVQTIGVLNINPECRTPNITSSKVMTPKTGSYKTNTMVPVNESNSKNLMKAPTDVRKKLFLELKKRFNGLKQSFDISKDDSSKGNIFERSSGYFGSKSFRKSGKVKKSSCSTSKPTLSSVDCNNDKSSASENLSFRTSRSVELTVDGNATNQNLDAELPSSLENSPVDEVDAVPFSDSVETSVEWIASQSCFSEEASPNSSNSQSYFTCDEGTVHDVNNELPILSALCTISKTIPSASSEHPQDPPQRPPRRKELKAQNSSSSETFLPHPTPSTSFGTIISEEYRYTDDEAGVTLIENHLLTKPVDVPGPSDTESVFSVPQTVISDAPTAASDVSSVPASFNYDSVTLRKELVSLGEAVGPITSTTKKVYLRRLYKLKKRTCVPSSGSLASVYSPELQRVLNSSLWETEILTYAKYEKLMCAPFENPDRNRRWREGLAKSSFNYLLLDPRLSDNLPAKIASHDLKSWCQFISSVFYVGKGKRSRPYAHLYQAVHLWNKGEKLNNSNPKIHRILDIWRSGHGVVCLHVFQNIIPVEAYSREAAMLDAIGLKSLVNMKAGEYYGPASTWRTRQKRQLGVYLLYRAMRIFLCEGERQLRPGDID